MTDPRLHALSPRDGRYADKCADLAALFSEAALIRARVRVEALWFVHLARVTRLTELAQVPAAVFTELDRLAGGIDSEDCARVKGIEARTNHDVKALR